MILEILPVMGRRINDNVRGRLHLKKPVPCGSRYGILLKFSPDDKNVDLLVTRAFRQRGRGNIGVCGFMKTLAGRRRMDILTNQQAMRKSQKTAYHNDKPNT